MTTRIQNHFHLDLPGVLDADGSPLAAYTAHERDMLPTAMVSVSVSFTGLRHRTTILDNDGNPVVHQDFRYRVRLTPAQYDTFIYNIGRDMIWVDHYHPDTGENASSFVKNCVMTKIERVIGITKRFELIEIDVEIVEL